jgi:hypothetical protein
MEFAKFSKLLRQHIDRMLADAPAAFVTNVDPDYLWEKYLDSFPPGTNEVYRERREHDDSYCRQFVRQFGALVTVDEEGFMTSIWDFGTDSTTYQPVAESMATTVKYHPIRDTWVDPRHLVGTVSNLEQLPSGTIQTWNHLHANVPDRLVYKGKDTLDTVKGKYRTSREVLQRALEEIAADAVQMLREMIDENIVYRGEEWASPLAKFAELQARYLAIAPERRENFTWLLTATTAGSIAHIRNSSIGTLLQDLSAGMDVSNALFKYEGVVAPGKYKTPKEVFTTKMVEDAEKKLTELGLENSLGRRFATLSDMFVRDMIFVDVDAVPYMSGATSIMAALKQKATTSPKQFENATAMDIEKFIFSILPDATSLEVLFENRHQNNLVSLLAPQNPDAPTMFKWNNNFSWAYEGNLADSEMKRLVREAGGKTDGVLRFSLQWETDHDLDAHAIEPDLNRIWFQNKRVVHRSSGMLDVDIVTPMRDKSSVENIVYTDIGKMLEGEYSFRVHCFTERYTPGGFTAEIEFDGQIYEFEYKKSIRQGKEVEVAVVKHSQANGFEIVRSLNSTTSMTSSARWELSTNQFHRVSLLCFSPNYWESETGNRHYMFMIPGCKNPDQPNGFFNEYLREDLMVHKRVFAALGRLMKVEPSDNQLSGIGFSSTKRDSAIVRVNNNRIYKIVF